MLLLTPALLAGCSASAPAAPSSSAGPSRRASGTTASGTTASGTTASGTTASSGGAAASGTAGSGGTTGSVASGAATATGSAPTLGAAAAGAALLAPADLGAGFTRATADLLATPGPCEPLSAPTVEQAVPSRTRVGVRYVAGSVAFVGEVITTYPDPATAERALDFLAAGLSCSSGTLHGADGTETPVSISAQGTRTELDGLTLDEVRIWTVQTSSLGIGLVDARIGSTLVLLQFGAQKTADTTNLRDSDQIAVTALRKVKTAP